MFKLILFTVQFLVIVSLGILLPGGYWLAATAFIIGLTGYIRQQHDAHVARQEFLHRRRSTRPRPTNSQLQDILDRNREWQIRNSTDHYL